MNLKELYQEIILDHGKNPRNLRKTENFNKDAKGNNPLCGDNVHVYLKLNDQRKVEGISFEGSGCAISMASADAIDIAHPLPSNEMPSTFLWSFSLRYTCTLSPHNGLLPFASLLKFSVFLRFLGFFP